MKKITKVIEMIKYNLKTLVLFELLFKICTIFLCTPFFLRIFNWIMQIRGYQYLTLENIPSFFLHPLTFFLILLLILLMTAYTVFDITTLIVILDSSYQKQKIKMTTAIHFSLKKCRNIIHLQNLPIAFLVLFLIPFLPIGISSNFISSLSIPEFILEYIIKNKVLLPLMIFLLCILTIILLHWMYSIHYFVLENCNFKEARKKSKELGKHKHLKDGFTLIFIQLVNVFLYIFFLLLGITILLFINNAFPYELLLKSFTTTFTASFITITSLLVAVLATPISYAGISVMYYFHKEEKKEKIKHIAGEKKDTTQENKKIKKGIVLICILALLVGTIFMYRIYDGQIVLPKTETNIEITAHRGASKEYPENTMRAFKGAKEMNADWIELDVQETKEGKIIVIHDSNLKRTTGVNKHVWELTYEEIKNLDAGSFMKEEFKNEKIPLLEEVVTFAKENNIKLNIELKPTGKEKDFEKKVIELIKEAKYEKNCVLASQNYSVLENSKKINKEITTLYVMSFAYGDITKLEAADHFSIEASSITENLVNKIHQENKQIYAWTINSEETMQKMIDLKVDNIITDNITLAKKVIEKNKETNFFEAYIKWIENFL